MYSNRRRSLIILAALTTLALACGAESATRPAAEAPFVANGGFIAVSVADVEASAQWYADKFELTTVIRVPKTNGVAVTVLEGNGLIVELMQSDAARSRTTVAPGAPPEGIHGVFKGGVIVENLDQTIAALQARGVAPAFGPFPAQSGQRANVIYRDNAGNLIQFFGRR